MSLPSGLFGYVMHKEFEEEQKRIDAENRANGYLVGPDHRQIFRPGEEPSKPKNNNGNVAGNTALTIIIIVAVFFIVFIAISFGL